MTDKNTVLVPEEGWHCLHLFYRVEHGQWQLLSHDEQQAAKTNLAKLVQEIRAIDSTQLLTLSVVTPKADLGFMLITPDLHAANRIEKQLSISLGTDVLTPVYSYLVAHRRKRIHHDRRRIRRRAWTRKQNATRSNWSKRWRLSATALNITARIEFIRRYPIGRSSAFII